MDNSLDLVQGGPAFRAIQTLQKGLSADDKKTSKKVTLVVFVGGCTFTEISACRFLSNKHEGEDILIGTTKIINGNSLIESLFDNLGEKEEFMPGSSITPSS